MRRAAALVVLLLAVSAGCPQREPVATMEPERSPGIPMSPLVVPSEVQPSSPEDRLSFLPDECEMDFRDLRRMGGTCSIDLFQPLLPRDLVQRELPPGYQAALFHAAEPLALVNLNILDCPYANIHRYNGTSIVASQRTTLRTWTVQTHIQRDQGFGLGSAPYLFEMWSQPAFKDA
jgi:hypothetical protein